MNIEDVSLLQEKFSDLHDIIGSQNNEDVINLIENYLSDISRLNFQIGLDAFDDGYEWINSFPLSFKRELKGKVVVLDFFTYCCINCVHILPYLKALEKKYSFTDGLQVIGVHSAKFSNEKLGANISAAAEKNDIKHPIINDSEAQLWSKFSIFCWPTVLVIGPNNKLLFCFVGESLKEYYDLYVSTTISYFEKNDLLLHNNIELPLTIGSNSSHFLFYPGKVNCMVCNMLIVSDSGHHRIVMLSISGKLKHVIGCGSKGLQDGDFENCQFNNPQGVWSDNHNIYVADTGNHALRCASLETMLVTTLFQFGGNKSETPLLFSPWDVIGYPLRDPKCLFIAMAGCHQIWAYAFKDLEIGKLSISAKACISIVGSGKEENRNNRYPHLAGFAQPSGLAVSEPMQSLFVADSESSTIRCISLVDLKVSGVVGGDNDPKNLFAYGDVDSDVSLQVKLQHPMDVSFNVNDGNLYIVDTYNNKVKMVNPIRKSCHTFPAQQALTLNEPSGLAVSPDGSTLWICDTNNHEIKSLNLKDSSFSILKVVVEDNKKCQYILKAAQVERGKPLLVKINVILKEGVQLSSNAPHKWVVSLDDSKWDFQEKKGNLVPGMILQFCPKSQEGSSIIRLYLTLYGCDVKGLCFMKDFHHQIQVYPTDEPVESPLTINNYLTL